jgi:2-polyprenyl-6-hydroxyphenyl methylase/3-demethylubiquinone-9 3-methyltransferase
VDDAPMGYYSEKLSGERLRLCYEIASPRVKQYLGAEIRFVASRLEPKRTLLELGCGYGRVALQLAKVAGRVVGIDTSVESLALARDLARAEPNCEFLQMDALDLRFPDSTFDTVVCIQNGICAFGVDEEALVREALRVARSGGYVLFSSYAERFWPYRLEWFEAQARRGLVGEIDYDSSGDGVIVCKDGFRAGTMTPGDFKGLCERIGVTCAVTEVDGSSVFCEIIADGEP